MEPRCRASPEQFSVLIDFMERYQDLSRPQAGPQGRIRSDKLWQELTLILNSLGGGTQKSLEKWKKVWADWKTKTKKKYLNLRVQANRTGGGTAAKTSLTHIEERVVAVIGVSAVIGQANIQELGFHAGDGFELPLELDALEVVIEDHNTQNIVIPSPATPAPPLSLPQQPSTPQPPQQPSTSQPPPPQQPPTLLPPMSPVESASPSPTSGTTPRRRALLRARRNRGLTPFERSAELFANVERKRLAHEEARDKRLHEREMERIAVTREHNALLNRLTVIGEQIINLLSHQQPSSLPSTGPI